MPFDRTTSLAATAPAVALATALQLDLPHGRCVAVWLPEPGVPIADAALSELDTATVDYGYRFPPRRAACWLGGRLALQRAAGQLGLRAGAMLPGPRGAPRLEHGVVGSISHKDDLAVALAAGDDGWSRGIDLERLGPPRMHIADRVLTAVEQGALDRLAADERWPALLLRFSIKESLYKALQHWVERWVAFDEATVQPADDGSCTVELALRAAEGPFDVQAQWWLCGDLLLTSCRLRPARGRA